jgi:hypothetical protein
MYYLFSILYFKILENNFVTISNRKISNVYKFKFTKKKISIIFHNKFIYSRFIISMQVFLLDFEYFKKMITQKYLL